MTPESQVVAVNGCRAYDFAELRLVLAEQFRLLRVDELVKPGMKITVKPNLLARSSPEEAVATHPLVVAAVVSLLKELGAGVLVAESPGGPMTPAALRGVYKACGYTRMAEEYGVELSCDCSYRELKAPNGKRSKSFNIITSLLDADLIVDIAKLKTHCMTGMSGAVKNMFGSVPGLMKPEMHCRFPEKAAFGEMLTDLCEAVSPGLCVVDAVTAMEGNGPSGGQPRHMGVLVASRNAFAADIACAALINMPPRSVWMLDSAIRRGLCPESEAGLSLLGEPLEKYALADFLPPESRTNDFLERAPRLLRPMLTRFATPLPKIRAAECIGCGKCAESCPQHTIELKNGKAVIAYGDCIRCYCCHEMCPAHVIDIKRLRLFDW